jgi:hypothetical protein
MARLLLAISLAIALLIPATAQAGARTSPHTSVASAHRAAATRLATLAAREPVSLATTLALRYWGSAPCGGQVSVQADQPLAAGLEASTDGWVTFESSLGPNDLQAPASSYSNCTISLAHWQWPTRIEMAGDWNMFCLTVVHEMGHLLGHPHSLTPGSVMAPVFTDETSVPAVCREARSRVEAAAGLAPAR